MWRHACAITCLMAKPYNCNLASQVDVNLDFVQAEQKNIYQMSFNLNLCSLKNYCWIKNHLYCFNKRFYLLQL